MRSYLQSSTAPSTASFEAPPTISLLPSSSRLRYRTSRINPLFYANGLRVDVPRLQQILTELETRPAGELESQTLEFKGWCRDEKDLCGELAEAAVCLANAD